MIPMHRLADDARCPGCSEPITGAVPIDADTKPKPGDLSVCGHCGALLEFTDDRGHAQHMPVSVFRGLPLPQRKALASVQGEVLAALKGGRL